MTDLVERLRAHSLGPRMHLPDGGLTAEAADEIERLEAKCVQIDRYIALLNDEVADNGKLRDEIERLRTEVAEWKRAASTNSPEDFILQMKADGERDD